MKKFKNSNFDNPLLVELKLLDFFDFRSVKNCFNEILVPKFEFFAISAFYK